MNKLYSINQLNTVKLGFIFTFIATCILIALCLSGCTTPIPSGTPETLVSQDPIAPAQTPNARAPDASFAKNLTELLLQVSNNHNVPLPILEAGFQDTKSIHSIKKLVLPPSQEFKKNWAAYRLRFIEPVRIKAAQAFWVQNREFLSQTEASTGVPAPLIVAIIGIETIYGRQLGAFRAKDVLTTLAFEYPPTPNQATREALFREQIKELILLCWAESNTGANFQQTQFNQCLNQNSSYAGAIGLPQFMPSSIRAYAKDGDGDNKIDLKVSAKDAIASVANFLQQQGWQVGMPIYFPLLPSSQALTAAALLADGEPDLKHTIQELIRLGILAPERGDLQHGGVSPTSKALIVDLPYLDKKGLEQTRYVVGLANFLSIVNYNRSYFYAQSVAEFAEALGYENKSAVPIIPQSMQSLVMEKTVPSSSSAKAKASTKKKRQKTNLAN
ncbi:lytic transglycosylase domain-containing protein [Polynucleobacter sp. IMCC 30228]|uniref:lytic murein transglycosylase n=1 Tax=Polynucleobacter sp. IMCC 30228 TaxID=2781011 RepID=UPI001F398553|nr:lytic murein transglycosylase [Polynucleobacter sp. IMCC 30228]MCE7527642.1 lytic murein transglycosylase [Polynucleobacter sp. IMCC 30228]